MKNILKAAIFTPISKGRWGLPVIAWSDPGEGKTSIIEDMAESFGLPCVVLSPGELGEGAFGVVPVPRAYKDDLEISYPAPTWCRQVEEGGLVFVDELGSTAPALQPPLLGLFFSRRIGGKVLGPRVRMLAAANPPETAANGFELAAPLANRCGHITWTAPTAEEHADFMMGVDRGDAKPAPLNAVKEEERVRAEWGNVWAYAVGLETGFLRRRPHLKNQCPKANVARAWPSDRSWEHATRALAGARVHGLSEPETHEFVNAFIGEATGNEFFTYIASLDLPDPADILDGRVKFEHRADRIDRTAAVLTSCTALVLPSQAKNREDRLDKLFEIFHHLTTLKTVNDLLVIPMKQLAMAHAVGKRGIKILAALNPVLRAAGITHETGLL